MKFTCYIHLASVNTKSDSGKWPELKLLLLNLGDYTFVYDYPLPDSTKPILITHELGVGTSTEDVIKLIAEDYKRLYQEDRVRAKANHKDGYHFDRHGLGDLFLTDVAIDQKTKRVTFHSDS